MERLLRIHADVDTAAAELAARHAARLRCGPGCADCCVDGLTVFEVEAERIRKAASAWLPTADPHPPGRCAFLDAELRCRIYEARPYVCRTQGLPLRWLGEDGGGGTAEFRDICPLNEPGPPLVSLPAEACWTLGPTESRLAGLQDASGRPGARVALRSLFREVRVDADQ